MKQRGFRFILVVLLFGCGLFLPLWGQAGDGRSAQVLAAAPESSGAAGGVPGAAWIISVKGDISPSLAAFVRREIKKAQDGDAGALVFEIDTFGGRVDSALQITSNILSVRDIPTIAWINNSAGSMGVSWSAGALIALSCGDIYMSPGTSIGAAAPVTVSPSGETEATGEKTVAAVRSQMAALAERNGHPVGIALAMVDLDVELWECTVNGSSRALTREDMERLERDPGFTVERGAVICPQGKLLSLTAGEAAAYGLASGIVESQEALFLAAGLSGAPVLRGPGAADSLVALLTSGPVQILLIIVGLVMIFLELQSPGFGFFGVTAIIAFLLVFGSNALLGTVASLEMLLFLIGLGLLAVEIFILPGFGVVGISGILLIGISLVLSMQDFVFPSADWEWRLLGRNIVIVALGIFAAIAGIAVIILMGPRLRMFDPLTLKTSITGTAGGSDDGDEYTLLPGKTGLAVTTLRPSGKARIEGKVYDVETEGYFAENGAPVRVSKVLGSRIVVEVIES
ncbi:MAG: nodulation protein NfeD [Spirochaetaceae bacterium]|jgi:membrane-bound serine protease (ClpP class)|nr:nodulation protein NfeD [Spirochaetaceae bacterium]